MGDSAVGMSDAQPWLYRIHRHRRQAIHFVRRLTVLRRIYQLEFALQNAKWTTTSAGSTILPILFWGDWEAFFFE
jgi:hypothetical protein